MFRALGEKLAESTERVDISVKNSRSLDESYVYLNLKREIETGRFNDPKYPFRFSTCTNMSAAPVFKIIAEYSIQMLRYRHVARSGFRFH